MKPRTDKAKNQDKVKRKRHERARRVRPATGKTGLPPETLVHVGERRTEQVVITVMNYNETSFKERDIERIEDCAECRAPGTVNWINVEGLHDVPLLERVGRFFDIHPLVLEDVLNTNQRPKLDDFGRYVYLVTKMLSLAPDNGHIEVEQVSFVLFDDCVVTFQERPGDVFDIIRDRLRHGKGLVRRMGADYLVFALLDAIVDYYFVILEKLGEAIEEDEEALIADPSRAVLERIHDVRGELLLMRRSAWPLRDVIGSLQRGETSLVGQGVVIYLRDLYDHTVQVIETVETYRDILAGMMDIYLSSVSNRMNEVMKVLTIISTIFIPLTFIVGVYGMNFEFMPELHKPWAYPLIWGVMLVIAVGMLAFFRRRKWL